MKHVITIKLIILCLLTFSLSSIAEGDGADGNGGGVLIKNLLTPLTTKQIYFYDIGANDNLILSPLVVKEISRLNSSSAIKTFDLYEAWNRSNTDFNDNKYQLHPAMSFEEYDQSKFFEVDLLVFRAYMDDLRFNKVLNTPVNSFTHAYKKYLNGNYYLDGRHYVPNYPGKTLDDKIRSFLDANRVAQEENSIQLEAYLKLKEQNKMSFINSALNKVKRRSPVLAEKLTTALGILWAENLVPFVEDITGVILPKPPRQSGVHDTDTHTYFGVYEWNDSRKTIYKHERIFNMMPAISQAALELHEAAYKVQRDYLSEKRDVLSYASIAAKYTPEKVRSFIGEIFSSEKEILIATDSGYKDGDIVPVDSFYTFIIPIEEIIGGFSPFWERKQIGENDFFYELTTRSESTDEPFQFSFAPGSNCMDGLVVEYHNPAANIWPVDIDLESRGGTLLIEPGETGIANHLFYRMKAYKDTLGFADNEHPVRVTVSSTIEGCNDRYVTHTNYIHGIERQQR